MTKISMSSERSWSDCVGPTDDASLGNDPGVLERNGIRVHFSAKSRSAIETIGQTYGLTLGEVRVLRAMVEVGGIRDIAAALSISPTTVKTHLRHIFQKTGFKGQVDLIRLIARAAICSEK